ncbi:MAG: hypothetical protein KDC54_15510 [Lewinella sp.]|nr:hypothetical protein [Lewinella sp.]
MSDYPDNPVHEIDGVFNYCFRWCERCPFTDRCGTFRLEEEMKQELAITEREHRQYDRSMDQLPATMGETLRLLRAFLHAMGENWEEVRHEVDEPEVSERGLGIEKLKKRSFKLTTRWFDDQHIPRQPQSAWSAAQRQATVVLDWYITMLAPKVNRAVSALTETDPAIPTGLQSDGNGSAKIALLGIARSLGALVVLGRELPDLRHSCRDYILDLLVIQQALRAYFPHVAAFERPGFDEPEYETELHAFYRGHLPVDPFRDGPWGVRAERSSDV